MYCRNKDQPHKDTATYIKTVLFRRSALSTYTEWSVFLTGPFMLNTMAEGYMEGVVLPGGSSVPNSGTKSL